MKPLGSGRGPSSGDRGHATSRPEFLVAALFGLTVLLNINDLITTSLALSAGLSEGNLLLSGLASATNLSLVDSLIILKVLFISACGVAALMGVGAPHPRTRQVATLALAGFSLVMLLVVANNLYWLLVT